MKRLNLFLEHKLEKAKGEWVKIEETPVVKGLKEESDEEFEILEVRKNKDGDYIVFLRGLFVGWEIRPAKMITPLDVIKKYKDHKVVMYPRWNAEIEYEFPEENKTQEYKKELQEHKMLMMREGLGWGAGR